MTIIRTLTLAVAAAAPLAAAAATYRLDDPGAMERLARDNPDHHARVTSIVQVIRDADCTGAPKAIPVQLQVKSLRCQPGILLTSWPAKREVSFQLDDATYQGRVAISPRENLVPLVDAGRAPKR